MVDYKENIPGSTHFTWGDAFYFPSWQVYHIPSESEMNEVVATATKMELIREFLGTPIIIHCWLRCELNNPASSHHGQDYNASVGGAPSSAHKIGKAVDWHATHLNCDDVRTKLLPKLEDWSIRMEDLPQGSGWVHIDTAPVVSHRFFKP